MRGLTQQPAPVLVRSVLPLTVMVLLCAVMLVPSAEGQMARLTSGLALAFLFHLTLFRPEGAPRVGVVIAGILIDLWSEALVGVSALLMLGFQQVVVMLRDDMAGLSFPWRWFAFCLLSALYMLAFGALMTAVFSLGGNHQDLVGRWAVATGLYPLCVALLQLMDHHLLYPERRR